LKVFANVKIAMQRFENFSGGQMPQIPPPLWLRAWLPLISYLGVYKHSSIVEHIIWVLSELSVGVNKMLNRIGRTCIPLLQ